MAKSTNRYFQFTGSSKKAVVSGRLWYPAADVKVRQQFEIAVLPLQNTTLFPETVVPLAVGRERSTRAVESALATEEKLIATITTRSDNVTGDDAKYSDLFKIGTIVNIKR